MWDRAPHTSMHVPPNHLLTTRHRTLSKYARYGLETRVAPGFTKRPQGGTSRILQGPPLSSHAHASTCRTPCIDHASSITHLPLRPPPPLRARVAPVEVALVAAPPPRASPHLSRRAQGGYFTRGKIEVRSFTLYEFSAKRENALRLLGRWCEPSGKVNIGPYHHKQKARAQLTIPPLTQEHDPRAPEAERTRGTAAPSYRGLAAT